MRTPGTVESTCVEALFNRRSFGVVQELVTGNNAKLH